MVFKNLLRRKFRTAMFILGISVILTGMQVLLGITNGLDHQIEAQFRRENLDVLTVDASSVMVFYSTIPERTAQALAAEPGVQKVFPAVLGLLQTPRFPMLVVYGLDPARFQNYRILAGRFPGADDEIAVGRAIRKEFGVVVGDAVVLNKQKVRVVGFFESGIETEDGSVLMTLWGARSLLGKEGAVSSVGIQAAAGSPVDDLIARLSARYPELLFTRARDYTRTQQNIQFIKGIGAGVGVLSVVGGAIIVFIFSLIIVQERTREIGLLRAVGWRRRRIIRLIVGETLALSAMGALLSLCFSSLILLIMQRTPKIASMLPVQFTLASVAITFAVALILGLGGGLASAWRASSMSPIEALGRE